MKRITFFIIALFALSTISAQQGQQGNREDFLQFFEKTIKPEVEKQQKEFFAVLTKAEKKEIKSLSLQADEIFAQAEENQPSENKSEFRNKMMDLRNQAMKIADAHPEQAETYRKSMTENIDKWKTEMPKRNNQKGMGNGKGKGQGNGKGQGRGNGQGMNTGQKGGGNQMLTQLTDPAWLLLWSPDRNPQMMMHAGRNGMGMQNPVMNNPELKAELKAYAEKSILPQIAESRKLFDTKLSTEEKAQITEARGKIKTRDAMQKAYMESDDFEPGSRRNDPNFDAFRESMQKSMMEMRTISSKYSVEITEIRNSLKPEYDQWLSDIEKIFSKYEDNKFAAGEMLSRAFKQNTSPMAFILFDTENPEFWTNRKGGHGNGMGKNNKGNRNCF